MLFYKFFDKIAYNYSFRCVRVEFWKICFDCEFKDAIYPTHIKEETENIFQYYKAIEYEEWIESQIYFMRRYDW